MKRAPANKKDVLRDLVSDTDRDDVFRTCVEQFYFSCKVKNLTEKTLSVYGERLKDFQAFLTRKHIAFDDVRKVTIQQYILDMKGRVSDHTINGRIRAMKTFFKFLVTEELWDKSRPNPMEGVSFVKTETKFKPVITQEDVERLLRVPNRKTFYGYRNFCVIYLFWDSLIRLSELLNLRIGDVDFKAGTVRVMGKGRKERMLPIGSKLLRHLHLYLNKQRAAIPGDVLFCTNHGYPIQKRHLQHVLERIGKRAKVSVTPHLIRHSAASHLALTGIPAFMLQRMLGHSSLNTTRMYIHLIDDKKLRDVFQQYSPGDSVRV